MINSVLSHQNKIQHTFKITENNYTLEESLVKVQTNFICTLPNRKYFRLCGTHIVSAKFFKSNL